MKKILMTQVLTGNGRTVFDGLFTKNGRPASIEVEVDRAGTVVTVHYDKAGDIQPPDCGISEEEIDRECALHDSCDDCPLYSLCGDEEDSDDE